MAAVTALVASCSISELVVTSIDPSEATSENDVAARINGAGFELPLVANLDVLVDGYTVIPPSACLSTCWRKPITIDGNRITGGPPLRGAQRFAQRRI
jgi:hypothetical protein